MPRSIGGCSIGTEASSGLDHTRLNVRSFVHESIGESSPISPNAHRCLLTG